MFQQFTKIALGIAAFAIAMPAVAGPSGQVKIKGNVEIYGEQKGAVTNTAIGAGAKATNDNAAIRGNVDIDGNVKITGIQRGAVTNTAIGALATARNSNAVITSTE